MIPPSPARPSGMSDGGPNAGTSRCPERPPPLSPVSKTSAGSEVPHSRRIAADSFGWSPFTLAVRSLSVPVVVPGVFLATRGVRGGHDVFRIRKTDKLSDRRNLAAFLVTRSFESDGMTPCSGKHAEKRDETLTRFAMIRDRRGDGLSVSRRRPSRSDGDALSEPVSGSSSCPAETAIHHRCSCGRTGRRLFPPGTKKLRRTFVVGFGESRGLSVTRISANDAHGDDGRHRGRRMAATFFGTPEVPGSGKRFGGIHDRPPCRGRDFFPPIIWHDFRQM